MNIAVFAKTQEFANQVKAVIQAFLNLELNFHIESDHFIKLIPEIITPEKQLALTIIDPTLEPRNIFHVLDSMNKSQNKVPVIVLTKNENIFSSELMGEKFQLDSHFHTIDLKWLRDDILKLRPILLNILSTHPMSDTLEIGNTFLDEDFFTLRTVNFYRIKTLPINLFLKRSADVYSNIIPTGKLISDEKVNLLTSRDIKNLYLLKEDKLDFIHHCIKDLNKSYDKGFESIEQKHMANALTYNITALQLQLSSPSEDLLHLNKAMLTASIKMIQPGLDFFSLLKNFSELDLEYQHHHGLLASYISYGIVQKMNWNSGIAQIKLALAFLLHDSTLPSNELAFIQDHRSDEFNNLDIEDKKTYQDHPQEAAELMKYYLGYPPDIQLIILDQHETPKGKGFPAGKTAGKIAPLSCVFIVAHALIHKLYKTDFSQNSIIQAIREIQVSYKGRGFEKVVEALFETFSLDC